MDMFDEMRTMLFLHRAVERDVSVLDAQKCVRIATLGGAEALGMEAEVGSLEAGKRADLIAVDVSRSHFAPIADPYSALVYGANQDDITLTVVGGRELYRDRAHVGVDADADPRHAPSPCAKSCRTASVPGAVEVGGADSGWWHARPSIERRPSKCCSIAAGSSSGRRSFSGSWRFSWPPSSSSGTPACSTAARVSTPPSPARPTARPADHEVQDRRGTADPQRRRRLDQASATRTVLLANSRLQGSAAQTADWEQAVASLQEGRQAPRQAEGRGRQEAAPGRAAPAWASTTCSCRTTRMRRRRLRRHHRPPAQGRAVVLRHGARWPSTPATPARRSSRSAGSSSSTRRRRTPRQVKAGSSRTRRKSAPTPSPSPTK